MIGATTDKDVLCKKFSALVSRFQVQWTLVKYTVEELALIVKNYKTQMHDDFTVKDEDYIKIVENCRGIPRNSIALLLKQLILSDINEVLRQSGIVQDGLTAMDIKILKILAHRNKPMGASFLSQSTGIPQSDYVEIYERFLIEKGYILRGGNGRVITEKGRETIESLES